MRTVYLFRHGQDHQGGGPPGLHQGQKGPQDPRPALRLPLAAGGRDLPGAVQPPAVGGIVPQLLVGAALKGAEGALPQVLHRLLLHARIQHGRRLPAPAQGGDPEPVHRRSGPW